MIKQDRLNVMKINLHYLHFIHALTSAREVKSIHRFCQLIKLAKNVHTRTRRVTLVNERSERHFKIQRGYFDYCQISLRLKKSLFCQQVFANAEG